MTVPRTDLALEAADDLAARAKKFSLPEGIQRLESLQEGYPVTDIRVTGEGSRTLGKPAGRYITVDLTPCFQRQQAFFHRAVWCIAYQLRTLLPHVGRRSQVLVVGLEAVDLRYGAADDDRHGVGHIVLVQRTGDGLLHHRAPQAHHVGVGGTVDGFFFRFLLCHQGSFLS